MARALAWRGCGALPSAAAAPAMYTVTDPEHPAENTKAAAELLSATARRSLTAAAGGGVRRACEGAGSPSTMRSESLHVTCNGGVRAGSKPEQAAGCGPRADAAPERRGVQRRDAAAAAQAGCARHLQSVRRGPLEVTRRREDQQGAAPAARLASSRLLRLGPRPPRGRPIAPPPPRRGPGRHVRGGRRRRRGGGRRGRVFAEPTSEPHLQQGGAARY